MDLGPNSEHFLALISGLLCSSFLGFLCTSNGLEPSIQKFSGSSSCSNLGCIKLVTLQNPWSRTEAVLKSAQSRERTVDTLLSFISQVIVHHGWSDPKGNWFYSCNPKKRRKKKHYTSRRLIEVKFDFN